MVRIAVNGTPVSGTCSPARVRYSTNNRQLDDFQCPWELFGQMLSLDSI
jgi:hypothetical protein